MTTIFRAEAATPTSYASKSGEGVNFVAPLTGNNLLAARKIDGVVKSTDLGLTWGSAFGLSQGGPWLSIHRMPIAIGIAPAGRLIAVPDAGPSLSGLIYVSDDDGVTWTSKTVIGPTSIDTRRGAKTVQRTDANGLGFIYMHPHDGRGTIQGDIVFTSTDGGETWSSSAVTNRRSASGIVVLANGTMAHATVNVGSPTNIDLVRYTSISISGTLTFPVYTHGSNIDEDTMRADAHIGDGLVGAVFVDAVGEFNLVTITDANVGTLRHTSSTGGIIIDVLYVTAIPGIPQKWAVVTRDSNNLYQLWVSNDNDHTTFTVHRTADGNNPDQGIMANMIPV